ncbi:hypothetical protein BH20ACI1_BH20ACI1_02470 [soil metagenome]
MKTVDFKLRITNYELRIFPFICGQIIFFCFTSFAQSKIAVIAPEKNPLNQIFIEKLVTALSADFKVLDDSLSEAAFFSAEHKTPFNLSTAEAKNIGAAIGCDYFLLIKAENLTRYSFEKKEYRESYAAVYAVSSRTGRLVLWKLIKGEDQKSDEAEQKLFDSIKDLSAEISNELKIVGKNESNEKPKQNLEELPAENSPEAKNFRPPLPFRQIKPPYTRIAYLYSIEATVDIEVDVDETGKILQTEIVRWAGFGLDESVEKNVRRMNWKAADRNGKNLPMRVLLRYNFKKVEPEEQ